MLLEDFRLSLWYWRTFFPSLWFWRPERPLSMVSAVCFAPAQRGHFRFATMRDRTRELRQASDSDSDSEGGEGRLCPPSDPVLAQARRVRAGLRALELKLAALEQQQELVLGCPLPPPELQRDLQQLRDEIQELTREIRGGLRGLEPAKEDEENPNSIGARLRRTQHGVLAQQFWGVTGRLQAAQARYRQRSLDRIRRQLHIAGSPPLSEEELEQMLESGHSEVFVSNVLGAARAARAALDEVGERHRDLQRLERGLRELGELFQLLGGTVEAQGEVIDRIERHVQDSGAHLGKGRGHLSQARRRQQGARKKRLAFAACVSVAIIVLVAIIAASVAAG
ncbi:syntaxin-4-like isoform X2 [Aphelocoma coerulescens]|uniref:syntaxin-4-like isoform X2 n=1 Tax=Aphelocoma coerulescens TaxID=39617 RepID=UPI003605162F